jgi:hypothetical protein
MKAIILICLFTIISGYSFGQTIFIRGTVKDGQGNPIPLAFVRDAKHYYATYADSVGSFLLKADPSSTLVAIAANYADTKVKIDNKATINIVMVKGVASSTNTAANSIGAGNAGASAAFLNNQPVVNQSGASTAIKAGFNQEATKGSPYLFANWVHGFAIGTGDSLLYDISNLYNYDKISGNLLFTKDLNSIMQVNKQGIKYFSLFNGKLHPAVFESAPSVNGKPFIEVMLSTPKYKIYKQTDTKLQRANFHTDGVIESGNRYDEYQDAVHYYFVKLPADKPKQFSLKKKNLKELLGADADKFISAQGDREVDDDYLRDLGYSLDQ